ncbi:MAG: DUF2058 family protein [Lysobacteraceae bacterium]|nr:MAG: DUF2058 family protein [Xanthomonadaceae bacterium]
MTDSLRDQLLGLGFKPAPTPERKPDKRPDRKAEARPDARNDSRTDSRNENRNKQAHKPGGGKPLPGRRSGPNPGPAAARAGQPRPARSREEMDLAKAYAIRAQKEKEERIEAERLKQEEARVRREAKAKVEVLLQNKALNDPAADIARHFPYGGKIKRVHVNAEQLKALNAGELGVVQQNGRYLLVAAAVLAEAESIFPACVALKVDPDAPAGDDPYADPQYQVPDDLVW